MVSTSSTNENDGSINENDGSTDENDGSTNENGSIDARPVRVRMAPSPTGSPHVGLARTALFNWAFARHHGGTFVFRIEDTDAARNTQESYDSLIEVMNWLGLDWDEGPLKGGPFAPYRQSERSDIYADVLSKLRESKFTYDCYCTTDEVAARRLASGSKVMGYDGFCRELSDEQVAAFRAEGRQPVVRFRMPDGSITFDDLVRGEITFQTEFVPDFALCRANGDPLYTLVAPVDDLLMEITHVLRGEDLLSSTPRQVALYDALAQIGVGNGSTPRVGHLPYVMGEGNKKLSKRDPQAHLLAYRDQGFLPEGLLNYLALLGWAIAADRDIFSLDEMVEVFDIQDVNPNPARFDIKKAEAINAAHVRLLTLEDLTERVIPFLQHAGLVADPVTDEQRAVLTAAMPLVGERINKLTEAVDMLSFLLVDEAEFALDPTDAEKLLNEDGLAVVRAAYDAVSDLDAWTTDAIQAALQAKLVDELGLKPRNAFGPVRVAVTGRRISPPLFESLELLGRDRGLGRLRRALA
jgi:glutamyl-tRNA synthetase